LVGVSSFGGYDKKGDADAQWIRSEKRREMKKRNVGKSFVLKSSSSADLRKTINLAKVRRECEELKD
jgi:hypothetical protein